ncbi:MAG: hypothetical protein RLY20_1094 [Verrucomicrobiota bacterium]|jgi:hypothetical protein
MDLDKNCANCEHWDGDGYCSLPRAQRKLAGFIHEPESVVCSAWDKLLSLPEREDKAAADEERSLYRHERY